MRKDLAKQFLTHKDFFTYSPSLDLNFKEKEIPFKDFDSGKNGRKLMPSINALYNEVKPGQRIADYFTKNGLKEKFFSYRKVDPNKSLYTITASDSGEFRHDSPHYLHNDDIILGGSFPTDYNFLKFNIKYLIGMSVPPVMTARIAQRVYNQWLSKL